MAGLDPELAAVNDGTDRSHVRSVARGGALNLVGAVVTSVAGFVLTVVVTRLVSPSTAGVFFSVTSLFILLAMVGRLGSGTGLVYFVSRAKSLGAHAEIARYAAIAMRPTVLLSAVTGLALAVAAPWLAPLLVEGHQDLTTAYLRQLAVFLPLAVAADLCQAVTRGYGTMRTTALVERIGRPLVQIPLVAAAAGASGLVLAGGWALPYLPAAAVSAWWVVRMHRNRSVGSEAPRPTATLRREYWRYALPRASAGVAQIALQRLDIILVGALRGPVDAAIYTAATRFLVAGQLANQAISMAVQPRIAGLLAVDDRPRTNDVYRSSTTWLVLLAWPVNLLIAVFSPVVLQLFGSGYATGSGVLTLLAAVMLVATGCGMVDVMLTMAGRTSWNLANVAIALVVNIGLNVLLIPRFGILGAAFAWSVAILVNNLVPLAQIWRAFGLHPFARGPLVAMALAAVCFGLVPLAVVAVAGVTLTAAITSAAIGVVAYAAGLWFLRRTLDVDLLFDSLIGRFRR